MIKGTAAPPAVLPELAEALGAAPVESTTELDAETAGAPAPPVDSEEDDVLLTELGGSALTPLAAPIADPGEGEGLLVELGAEVALEDPHPATINAAALIAAVRAIRDRGATDMRSPEM